MSWIRLPSGDLLKWVAAGCALVATASAEYELARAVGMSTFVAAAVPGALDAYVVRALRAHREVLTSVLAMVAVNAASHLLSTGILHLDWILVTAVSAIAPVVLWRVHALGTPGEARRRALWGADTVSPPVEHGCPLCLHEHTGPCSHFQGTSGACLCGHTSTLPADMCSWGHEHCDGEHGLPSWLSEPLPDVSTFEEHAAEAVSVASTETCPWCDWDGCPAGEVEFHQRHTCLKRWEHACEHGHAECIGHGGTCMVDAPSTEDRWTDTHPFPYEWSTDTPSTPVLRLVPDLPAAFTASTFTDTVTEHVAAGVILPSDTAFMERARVLAGQAKSGTPSVRAVKAELGTGTARAQRLVAALTIEHARAQEGSTS